MNPFDFVNAISYSKKDIMRGTVNDAIIEKDYTQFIINKSLSYFNDTILFVNEMNIRNVDNRMHFTYLLNAIRPRKRFSKWDRLENSDTIDLIQKHYKYSYNKAKEASKLLSVKQVEVIKSMYNEGGTK
jgi:hypothetical protein